MKKTFLILALGLSIASCKKEVIKPSTQKVETINTDAVVDTIIITQPIVIPSVVTPTEPKARICSFDTDGSTNGTTVYVNGALRGDGTAKPQVYPGDLIRITVQGENKYIKIKLDGSQVLYKWGSNLDVSYQN